jgi:hypothetical protein
VLINRAPAYLTWTAASAATGYRVQISPSDDFTTFTREVDVGVGTLYYQPLGLAPGVYYWRVLAQVGGTMGAATPVGSGAFVIPV